MPEETKDQNTQDPEGQPGEDENVTFESLLEKLDPKGKELYEQHTAGLLNTVKATRDERDQLKNQIKDLLPKAEKGSELEKTLTEFTAKLEVAEKRATFIEEAVKPGIDCRNPKIAYMTAVSIDAFDKRGNPQWDLIKKEAPELFGKIVPKSYSGEGTDDPPNTLDINAQIRRASGRR